jgi:hypothetical protein
MAELQIQIGADVNSAVAGLNQVQTELDQTGKSAAALNGSLSKAAAGLSKLPQSAGQASNAVTNLNRVVQDAPFGFIGIQNNIGPLIDSFGALKASTGSTGGAIKALVGTLAGPAGIGLAVAAVSSALTFAIQGFSSWTRGLGDAKQATDKLAESVATDLVQLTTIVGLIQNTAASTADREKALKVLNEEYGKYLPNLDREAITLDNINEKYQAIIDTMLRQAVVKGIQDEITKQVTEAAKQITQLQLARERERLELDKGNKTKFQTLTVDQKLAQIADQKNKVVTDGVIAFNKQTQAEKAAIGTTNVYDMMIEGLKNTLMETLAPALKLATAFEDLGKTTKATKLEFEFEPIIGISQRSILEAKEANRFEIGILTNAYQKKLEDGFKKLKPIQVPLKVSPELQGARDAFKALQEPLLLFNAAIDNINQNISSSVSSLFEGVGEALAGENITQKITSVFSTLLNAVGKALIQYGIVKEGLDKILGPAGFAIPGATAIGLGIAAIAASTLLKNFGGARADGGPVSGNTPYLVGERGPELFVPSTSGKIVPNNQVPSFGGGLASMLGMGGRGGTTLRGQDILLASARTHRSQLRVNG